MIMTQLAEYVATPSWYEGSDGKLHIKESLSTTICGKTGRTLLHTSKAKIDSDKDICLKCIDILKRDVSVSVKWNYSYHTGSYHICDDAKLTRCYRKKSLGTKPVKNPPRDKRCPPCVALAQKIDKPKEKAELIWHRQVFHSSYHLIDNDERTICNGEHVASRSGLIKPNKHDICKKCLELRLKENNSKEDSLESKSKSPKSMTIRIKDRIIVDCSREKAIETINKIYDELEEK